MSVTNCSQPLWQCFWFFYPVPFLWPSFFPFLLFFLFFPSRSGAPDVKERRYGPLSPSLFFFSFILYLFALLTHSFPSTFQKNNLFCFLPCSLHPSSLPLPSLSRWFGVLSFSTVCVCVSFMCASPLSCPLAQPQDLLHWRPLQLQVKLFWSPSHAGWVLLCFSQSLTAHRMHRAHALGAF